MVNLKLYRDGTRIGIIVENCSDERMEKVRELVNGIFNLELTEYENLSPAGDDEPEPAVYEEIEGLVPPDDDPGEQDFPVEQMIGASCQIPTGLMLRGEPFTKYDGMTVGDAFAADSHFALGILLQIVRKKDHPDAYDELVRFTNARIEYDVGTGSMILEDLLTAYKPFLKALVGDREDELLSMPVEEKDAALIAFSRDMRNRMMASLS